MGWGGGGVPRLAINTVFVSTVYSPTAEHSGNLELQAPLGKHEVTWDPTGANPFTQVNITVSPIL